jgi:hypothetical protein
MWDLPKTRDEAASEGLTAELSLTLFVHPSDVESLKKELDDFLENTGIPLYWHPCLIGDREKNEKIQSSVNPFL